MRPKKIVINAFGPYAEEEIIDFTELKNNNLFLISGPTGSGKTTIFDAMSFALYGESNGEQRSVDQLRSQFASENTLTKVKFKFSVKGFDYEITREPAQLRPKIRGEGYTNHTPDATLRMLDEKPVKVITGINQVTDKIVEILGIDSEQFRQIMMIPQGEFRKLLVSDSQEREKILQKLFDTKIYRKVQDELKEKEKDLRSKREKIVTSKNESINRINYDNNEDLKELINSENRNIYDIVELLKTINKDDEKTLKTIEKKVKEIEKENEKLIEKKTKSIELNNKFDKLEKLNKELKILEDKKNEIDSIRKKVKLIKKAKDIKPIKDSLDKETKNLKIKKEKLIEIKKQKKKLESSFKKIKKEYNKQKSKEEIRKRENLNEKIINLKSLADDVKEIDLLNDKETNLEKKFNRIKNDIEKNNKKIDLLKEGISKNKDKVKNLSESIDLVKINEDINYNKNILEKLNNLSDLKEKLIKLNNEYNINKEKLYSLKKDYKEKEKSFKQNKIIFFNNQAAILAKELKEDEACPVCGSVDHPNLAILNDESITEDELNEYEKIKDKAYKKYKEKEKFLNSLKRDIENTKDNFYKILNNLEIDKKDIDLNFIKEKIKVNKNKLSELEDIKSKVLDDKKKIDKLNKKIIEDEKSLESCNETVSNLIEKKHNLKNEITKIKTKLDNIYQKIPKDLRSMEKLNSKIKNLSNEYKKLNEVFEKSVKRYNDHIVKIEKNSTIIETTIEDIETLEKNVEKISKEFNLKLEENNFDKDSFNRIVKDISKINEFEKKIKNYEKEYNKTKNYYESLYKEIKDKEKINIKVIEEKIETLNKEKEIKNEKKGNLASKIKNNKYELKNINELSKKINEIEKEYKVLGQLANVANGNNEKRITFERYVLAAFLEDIISAANIRLDKMTSGRYSMLRTDKKERANRQSGLEIEVFDSYTGKTRHVKTLSGGESFKASLSMALGLSDVVQEYAGNVRLDTMFIDEGFGTLDSESLESAINCLIDLQNRGRLVGIISHVGDLKERIEARLEVKATSIGSETNFVVL